MKQNFIDGQEIVHEDLNNISNRSQKLLLERVIFEIIKRNTDCFFTESHKVVRTNATTAVVQSGVGFQNVAESDPAKSFRRMMYLPINETVNFLSPDPTNFRIDLVVAKATEIDGATATRNVKAAGTGTVSSETVVIERDFKSEITVVTGVASATPTAPATPAGTIVLAQVLMVPGVGIADQSGISDFRTIISQGEVSSVEGRTGAITLSAADVDLENCDNTSDDNKPISSATQTALNLKADVVSLAPVATSGLVADASVEKVKLAPTALHRSFTSIAFAQSPYTVPTTVEILDINAIDGAVTVTLEDPSTVPGKKITIRKTDFSANKVTVGYLFPTPTIIQASKLCTPGELINLVATAAGWIIENRVYDGTWQTGIFRDILNAPIQPIIGANALVAVGFDTYCRRVGSNLEVLIDTSASSISVGINTTLEDQVRMVFVTPYKYDVNTMGETSRQNKIVGTSSIYWQNATLHQATEAVQINGDTLNPVGGYFYILLRNSPDSTISGFHAKLSIPMEDWEN